MTSQNNRGSSQGAGGRNVSGGGWEQDGSLGTASPPSAPGCPRNRTDGTGEPSKAERYLAAARVPASLEPQRFGMWTIERRGANQDLGNDRALGEILVGWPDYTILRKITIASLHVEHIGGEVVMEDSARELRKHLPIWLRARGRVLKTGLGLGCVVRGLLANPAVEHVDVVEIDADIIRVVGAQFVGNPRVSIHHADAETWDYGDRTWDFAWHDVSTDGDIGLQVLHARLIARFWGVVRDRQGAWAFPRDVTRRLPFRLIGAPRTGRQAVAA